jgi:succinyl-diaminopimelate desuccinylase
MVKLLTEMLSIPSPTFHEQELTAFIKKFAQDNFPTPEIREFKDCLIIELGKENTHLPHITMVGHSDVVPQWFKPHIEGDKLYGAGGSDMLAAEAAFFRITADNHQEILKRARISIVIYSREEGTKMEDNGLYDLIGEYPDFFKSIDLAIVGEPTDNTIQIGCCGSLHARVVSTGMACHSARPWNGENAFYKALPFITAMAKLEPVKHEVFGCDFFDVLSITEENCTPGRTSIPGRWEANVNFRYAPVRTPEEAEQYVLDFVNDLKVDGLEVSIKDNSPSGTVHETELFAKACKLLNFPVQAKQAWTDVAQLSAMGVPCFNFGPGLTAQAHKDNEYCLISLIEEYGKSLKNLLVNI